MLLKKKKKKTNSISPFMLKQIGFNSYQFCFSHIYAMKFTTPFLIRYFYLLNKTKKVGQFYSSSFFFLLTFKHPNIQMPRLFVYWISQQFQLIGSLGFYFHLFDSFLPLFFSYSKTDPLGLRYDLEEQRLKD